MYHLYRDRYAGAHGQWHCAPHRQLPVGGGAAVFAPNAERRLARAVQTEMMVKGERECVSLVLQDGRTLTCTPEQRDPALRWPLVRADALKTVRIAWSWARRAAR